MKHSYIIKCPICVIENKDIINNKNCFELYIQSYSFKDCFYHSIEKLINNEYFVNFEKADIGLIIVSIRNRINRLYIRYLYDYDRKLMHVFSNEIEFAVDVFLEDENIDDYIYKTFNEYKRMSDNIIFM